MQGSAYQMSLPATENVNSSFQHQAEPLNVIPNYNLIPQQLMQFTSFPQSQVDPLMPYTKSAESQKKHYQTIYPVGQSNKANIRQDMYHIVILSEGEMKEISKALNNMYQNRDRICENNKRKSEHPRETKPRPTVAMNTICSFISPEAAWMICDASDRRVNTMRTVVDVLQPSFLQR